MQQTRYVWAQLVPGRSLARSTVTPPWGQVHYWVAPHTFDALPGTRAPAQHVQLLAVRSRVAAGRVPQSPKYPKHLRLVSVIEEPLPFAVLQTAGPPIRRKEVRVECIPSLQAKGPDWGLLGGPHMTTEEEGPCREQDAAQPLRWKG